MPINFFDGYCVSPKPSYRLKHFLMLRKFVFDVSPLELANNLPRRDRRNAHKALCTDDKKRRLRPRKTQASHLHRRYPTTLRDRLTKYKNSQQLRHRPTITANFPQLEGISPFLGS